MIARRLIIVLCLVIPVVVLFNSVPLYAQEPPQEVETELEREGRREEAAARARREAMHEAAKAWREEYVRLPSVEEIEARIRRREIRFRRDVNEFLRVAADIVHYRLAPLSERWAVEGIGDESEELDGLADRILRFLTDGQSGDVRPSSALIDLTTAQKLAILNRITSEVGPRLVSLAGGNVLDVNLHREIVEGLTNVKVLGKVLQR